MERGHLEKLKFDRRLRMRRGWVDAQDTDGYLAALPDVTDKIAVASEDSAEPSEAGQASESGTSEGSQAAISAAAEVAAQAAPAPQAAPGSTSYATGGQDHPGSPLGGGMAGGGVEPQAATADESADRPVDPLSPPPFKKV